jgi:hypothetical protein
MERGLNADGDEARGLRVDDDVPAERHAADDLPGVRRRILRADAGREGPVASGSVTPGTVEETRSGGIDRHAGFATPFYDSSWAASSRSGHPQMIMS